MKRRAFITLLGGAAVTWPLAARAQQSERVQRIGVLMSYLESDPEARAWYAAFREGLQKLGWTEGRNTQIDTRWAAPDDAESMRRFAKELVALQPDLILSNTSAYVADIDPASSGAAQRASIWMLRPSVHPSFWSPSRNAAYQP